MAGGDVRHRGYDRLGLVVGAPRPACDPTCVMLVRICESFREAADPHMGTPMGCSTACQSQVLPRFRPKHGRVVSIRKVVVLGSFAGENICRAAGGGLLFFLVGP